MTVAKPVPPASAAPLTADLDAALRRLKLATVRRNAAEVLQVAKTQRWTPEEILRTLVEAEIAARDASNTANRLKAAAFPVTKPSMDSTWPDRRSFRRRSTICLVWNGFGHNRIWRSSGHRAQARATCSSAAASRREGRIQGPVLHRC